VPLRIVGVLGTLAISVDLILLAISVAQYFRGTAASGFTTVIFLGMFMSGIQLIAVGVLASLSRVFTTN